MKLDKYYFETVNFVSSKNSEDLTSYLKEVKFISFQINNKEVKDKESFIEEIAKIAPLQDEIDVGKNWDLLMDCFWQYATMTPDAQIAIVLHNTELFLTSNLQDLWHLINQFRMLSDSLKNPSNPKIPAKKLQLFLIGEGPNFES